MHYTIYKVTNKIDGKVYIGSHKTKDLNDDYMGSGTYLKRAQEKYGIENFKKEILFVFNTPEEMYAKEAEIVNVDFLITENTYNLKLGGFGGWDYINENEITRKAKNIKARENANITILEKYGVQNPGQLQHNREAASIRTTKRWEEGEMKAPPSFTFKGKSHTEETKRLIGEKNSKKQSGSGNSQFGTMWITNGTDSKQVKKDCFLPEGWYKGRKQK